jgi:PAS domain S-box-containing protein
MFRRILEDAPEAILVADRAGTIVFWNAGAEAMFGHAAAEAVGQTLDLIVPEPQRARHWAGYQHAIEAGTSRYGRDLLAVPALRKDGSRLSLEFHVVLLRAADGQVEAIAAIIRDVTERWQRERGLRQQLQALQARLEQERPAETG